MKLSPSGRNRLDAMKKALAAGLPLAGLLAAAACSKGPQAETSAQSKSNWVYLGEAEAPLELDPPSWITEDIPMGELIPDDPVGEPDLPKDELHIDTTELCIAADVPTSGVLVPPDVSHPPEVGGEVDWHSDDDVVIRVEDAAPAENGEP